MTNNADPDQKPTDLDLHCLQRQGISRFSRTRVNDILMGHFVSSLRERVKRDRRAGRTNDSADTKGILTCFLPLPVARTAGS